jgi:hypothetical protein
MFICVSINHKKQIQMMWKLKVLDLFAGSRSMSKEAGGLGHDTFSSDLIDFGGIDYVCDVLDFDVERLPWRPDVVWASPPCTGFSVASIGHHWTGGKGAYIPKTETARLGKVLLEKTLSIIEELEPKYWFIENPRGLMRKMPHWNGVNHVRNTVTYCQYGDTRMKPTDIWTNSKIWKPRPMCKNGAPCHVAAPRGSRTGTQGLKNNFERSKVPGALCREILHSAIF